MSSSRCYLRHPRVAIALRDDACLFVRPGRDAIELSDVDTAALASLFELLALITPHEVLAEHLEPAFIEYLLSNEILVSGTHAELQEHLPRPGSADADKPFRRLVFGLTGAISASQVVWHLFELKRLYCQRIDVIMTEAAQRIVRPELLRYLGLEVWEEHGDGLARDQGGFEQLARDAEMVVVVPASARTLQKLAGGANSDMLSKTVACTRAPVVIVPVTNGHMWTNPAVARSVEQLREDGRYVVVPRAGVEVSQHEAARAASAIGGGGVLGSHLPDLLLAIRAAHRDSP